MNKAEIRGASFNRDVSSIREFTVTKNEKIIYLWIRYEEHEPITSANII